MDASDIIRDLRFPIDDDYFLLPTIIECRVVLENLGKDFKKQKNHDVLRHHPPTTWKFLTDILGKWVNQKIRILDQMNSFEKHILFSIIKNKQPSSTQLIFNQIVEIIKVKKMSIHVPYPKRFAPTLQYVGTVYVDNQVIDWIHSFTSSKLFNQDPDEDWRITKGYEEVD